MKKRPQVVFSTGEFVLRVYRKFPSDLRAACGGRMDVKMTFVYPAVFSPDERGGYHVSFPDLACCYAQGADLEDAIDNAADAAYNWILSELEEEECHLPSQTAMEHIVLGEGELVRQIMVRIKLLPDND